MLGIMAETFPSDEPVDKPSESWVLFAVGAVSNMTCFSLSIGESLGMSGLVSFSSRIVFWEGAKRDALRDRVKPRLCRFMDLFGLWAELCRPFAGPTFFHGVIEKPLVVARECQVVLKVSMVRRDGSWVAKNC